MNRLHALVMAFAAATVLTACGDSDSGGMPMGPGGDGIDPTAVRDALRNMTPSSAADAQRIAEMMRNGFEVDEAMMSRFFEAYPKYIAAVKSQNPAAIAAVSELNPAILGVIAAKFTTALSREGSNVPMESLPANLRLTDAERQLFARYKDKFEALRRSATAD